MAGAEASAAPALAFVKGARLEVNADGLQEEKPLAEEEKVEVRLGSGPLAPASSSANTAGQAVTLYDQLVKNAVQRVEVDKYTSVIKEAKEEDTFFFTRVEQQRQSRAAQEVMDKAKTAEQFREEKARLERERVKAKTASLVSASLQSSSSLAAAALGQEKSARDKEDRVGIVVVKRRKKVVE